MVEGLSIAVLGPVEVRRDGALLALGTPRRRMVLTALALRHGAPVPMDVLIELVWGDEAPASAENTVQGYVSGLRKVLERDRAPRARGEVIVLEPGGYALHDATLDVLAFESGIDAVQRDLGTARDATGLLPVLGPGRIGEVLVSLDHTLSLWRGTPFAELGDAPEATAQRGRLDELRLLGLELRASLEIVLGREARVSADLETLTVQHPLRERLWALRALALARTGRQADALGVLSTVRELLNDELGIDPGPELSALQVAVLRQETRPPSDLRRHGGTQRMQDPPLVGRAHELDRLLELHDQVVGTPGPPAFAILTGEAGVGKSRLARELLARAEAAGSLVVAARCPQDEGAPPLWPWSRVLAGVGVRMPEAVEEVDGGARFRAWGRSIEDLLDGTLSRPTVVLLDDLHWADPSTLRLLAMLAATDQPARLLVVVSWRSEQSLPRPVVELEATLARRHPIHLPLDGVGADEVASIVGHVTGAALGGGEAEQLLRRTGGNPYFLVELARVRQQQTDVSGEDSSDGIRAVIAQHLETVPDEVIHSLQVAAVLGREFDVVTLAAVSSTDEMVLLEQLEQALAAGLIQEVDVDRFRFAHELLREQVRSKVTRTRGTRIHAAAAEQLASRGAPGTESDLARHWLSAGPRFSGRAWRAAREAAEVARRVHAHDERVQLLRAAVAALDTDTEALAEDRCDLLLELAEALRVGAQWLALRPVVHEALTLAEGLEDDDRAFAAATMPTTGAFWLASPYGQVDLVVVAGLRRLLARLPARDGRRRCRLMLSLASEIYYASSFAEREALVDEAIEMARRLGDERLLLAAYLAGSSSVWRSSRTPEQRELASEAVALARRLGDPAALAEALTTLTAAANDLGLMEEMGTALEEARSLAVDQRLYFSQVVLDGIEIGWCASRGDLERLQWLTADMIRAAEPMELTQLRDSFVAVEMMRLLWGGQVDDLLAMLQAAEADALVPVEAFIAALLCRTGRADEAAAYVATHDLRVDGDDWLSPAIWSLSAECALHLDDPTLAARVYARLAPLAGRPATAGSGVVLGPVDLYLAMAALAVGERETARRHADDAERIASDWGVEPVRRWIRSERGRWSL